MITTCVFSAIFVFRSKHAHKAGSIHILHYPWSLKIFALLGSTLFLTGIAYLFQQTNFIEAMQCLGIISPFLALVIFGTIEVLFFELSFDEKRIFQRSPWSGTREIRFDEITQVDYSNFTSQYRICTEKNSTIRLTRYLLGAEALLDLVAQNQSNRLDP